MRETRRRHCKYVEGLEKRTRKLGKTTPEERGEEGEREGEDRGQGPRGASSVERNEETARRELESEAGRKRKREREKRQSKGKREKTAPRPSSFLLCELDRAEIQLRSNLRTELDTGLECSLPRNPNERTTLLTPILQRATIFVGKCERNAKSRIRGKSAILPVTGLNTTRNTASMTDPRKITE